MKSLIVWDLETSGFVDNPDARILEIGAFKVVNGEVQQETRWMLNHDIEIPEKITELTGITKGEIDRDGREPRECVSEFMTLLAQADHHLTHNGFRFDIPFLTKQLRELFGPGFDFYQQCLEANGIDTAVYYKAQKLGLKQEEGETFKQFADRVMEIRAKGVKYNVGIACDELGIDRSKVEQHRALADVELTYEIYKKITA